MNFREVSCHVCGAVESRPFCVAIDRLHGVPGRFAYVICESCGLLFQNPQVAPEDIASLYPADYAPWAAGAKPATTGAHANLSPDDPAPAPGTRRRSVRAALRDAFTITGLRADERALLDAGGSLLDVGCGSGKFLARVRADHPAARVEGLDFSPAAVAAVRDGLGLTAHLGTVQSLADGLSAFDVITMWWYLEHEPDPETVLAACRRLLKPGGRLVIGVPNARSVSRHLFRSRWFHLDPPRHLWIHSPATLPRLLAGLGFRTVAVKHDLAPWGILGSLEYVVRGRIDDVDRSWVSSRVGRLVARPLSMLAGAAGWGDTIAVHATPA